MLIYCGLSNLEDQSTSDLKERIKTDNNLIKEIILTEKDYVYDLSVIIEARNLRKITPKLLFSNSRTDFLAAAEKQGDFVG